MCRAALPASPLGEQFHLQSLVEIDVAQKTAVDFPAPLMTVTGELGVPIARETARPA